MTEEAEETDYLHDDLDNNHSNHNNHHHDSSSDHLVISPASPSDSSDLAIANRPRVIKLQGTVQEITRVLSDKATDTWLNRVSSLQRIVDICTNSNLSAAELSYLFQCLSQPLELQLSDIRSKVIKETCTTIAILATTLHNHFDEFSGLVGPLMNLLKSSKQVISSSADEALLASVNKTTSQAVLAEMLNNLPLIKGEPIGMAAIHLAIIVENWPVAIVEKYRVQIIDTIKSLLNTSAKQVRSVARLLFYRYYQRYPRESKQLYSQLSNQTQNLIHEEFPATELQPEKNSPSYLTQPEYNIYLQANGQPTALTLNHAKAFPGDHPIHRAIEQARLLAQANDNGKKEANEVKSSPSPLNKSLRLEVKSPKNYRGAPLPNSPQYENLHSELSKQRAENQRLIVELTNLRAQKGRVDQISSEKDVLDFEVTKLKRSLDKANVNNSELTSALTNSRLDMQKQAKSTVEAREKEHEKEMEQLRQQLINDKDKELANLQQKLEAVNVEKRGLLHRLEGTQGKLRSYERQMDEMQAEIDNLKGELAEKRMKLEALEAEKNLLSSHNRKNSITMGQLNIINDEEEQYGEYKQNNSNSALHNSRNDREYNINSVEDDNQSIHEIQLIDNKHSQANSKLNSKNVSKNNSKDNSKSGSRVASRNNSRPGSSHSSRRNSLKHSRIQSAIQLNKVHDIDSDTLHISTEESGEENLMNSIKNPINPSLVNSRRVDAGELLEEELAEENEFDSNGAPASLSQSMHKSMEFFRSNYNDATTEELLNNISLFKGDILSLERRIEHKNKALEQLKAEAHISPHDVALQQRMKAAQLQLNNLNNSLQSKQNEFQANWQKLLNHALSKQKGIDPALLQHKATKANIPPYPFDQGNNSFFNSPSSSNSAHTNYFSASAPNLMSSPYRSSFGSGTNVINNSFATSNKPFKAGDYSSIAQELRRAIATNPNPTSSFSPPQPYHNNQAQPLYNNISAYNHSPAGTKAFAAAHSVAATPNFAPPRVNVTVQPASRNHYPAKFAPSSDHLSLNDLTHATPTRHYSTALTNSSSAVLNVTISPDMKQVRIQHSIAPNSTQYTNNKFTPLLHSNSFDHSVQL
jgi:hypothetical protein